MLISIIIAKCAAIMIDTHSTLFYKEIVKTNHVSAFGLLYLLGEIIHCLYS